MLFQDAQGNVQIIGDAAMKLFEFPDSLLSICGLPQKLEILLPLHQEMLNIIPILNALFPHGLYLTKNMQDHASDKVCRLRQQLTRLLSVLERQVSRVVYKSNTRRNNSSPD